MKKILVVDNSKAVLRIFTDLLTKHGCEVMTAEDGLAALNVLASFEPDAMFVDLVMPVISGEKLCRAVREMPQFQRVPIVVISGIAAEEEIDFTSFGANACIAKGPIAVMEQNVLSVLGYLQEGNTGALVEKVFGHEHLYEREVTKELLANNRHFEVALNNISDGFLELTMGGTILFSNSVANLILNMDGERILGLPFSDFFPMSQRKMILSATQALAEGGEVELGEEEPIALHGRYINLKFVCYREKGTPYIIVVIRDISSRKNAEMLLREHHDKLEEVVKERTAVLEEKNRALEEALAKVKTLSGLLPICSSCKKIRDDQGYWNKIEKFISEKSEAVFSHGICPDCAAELYPEYTPRKEKT